jgi:hypothetical protein
LEEEAETFVFGVEAALLNELAEVGEIAFFLDGIERFGYFGLGQLECAETCLDLHPPPSLVFHLVMYVRIAETGVIQEVPFVQNFLDGFGDFCGCAPLV